MVRRMIRSPSVLPFPQDRMLADLRISVFPSLGISAFVIRSICPSPPRASIFWAGFGVLWVGFGHVGKSGSRRANNERVGHESPDRSLFRPSSSHRLSHAPGPFLGQVCGFGGLDWPRAGTTLSRGTAHVVASLLIVWPPCANVRIGTPVPPRCDRVLDFDFFPPASRTF